MKTNILKKKSNENKGQNPKGQTAVSTNPTIKELSVVMEFDDKKNVFHFVKKLFKEQGLKIMPLCSNVAPGDAPLNAAHKALVKGTRFTTFDRIGEKPHFYKDEHGEYLLHVYFGFVNSAIKLSGTKGCTVMEIKPEEVDDHPDVTGLTKACLQIMIDHGYFELAAA